MAKTIDTESFAKWATSAFGINFDDDPELQTALEAIGASNFDIEQMPPLNLESLLIIFGKLTGHSPTSDKVLHLCRRALLYTGRQFFLAASLLESIQQKRS